MFIDLKEEWGPECFDIFFVAAGAGNLLGWDSYEGDYFGIGCDDFLAEEESMLKLKKMTKEERSKVFSCFQKYSPKKQGIVIYYLNKMKQVINQYKKSQKEKILAKDEKFKSRKKERGC